MWENIGADDGKGAGCDRLPLSGNSGKWSRQVQLPSDGGADGGMAENDKGGAFVP